MSIARGPSAGPSAAVSLRKKSGGLRRALVALVAVAALGLVAYVVPLRDRCAAPLDPTDTMAAVDAKADKKFPTDHRADGTCIVHASTGDVAVAALNCGALRCEPGLIPVVAHAKVGVLLLLALCTILGTLLSTLRWFALLKLAGFRRSFGWVWRVCLSSQAGALLLPGGVGGDALRFGFTFGAGKAGKDDKGNAAGEGAPVEAPIPTATLAATVLLDRMLGLVSLTTLGGLLAAAFGGPSTGKLVYILMAIPPLFFAGFALARTDFVFGWSLWRQGLGAKLQPVFLYIRRPGAFAAVARGLLASAFFSALQLGVVRGIVYALGGGNGPGFEEHWVFLGGAMGLLVAGLPGLPGGWGTADAAYVFFLGRAGLSPSTSLAVCLLNRIFYYGVAAVGAGVLLATSAAAGASGTGGRAKTHDDAAKDPSA